MLRLIFVTDATAAGRLWSIRQNHPESGSDVLNLYLCQQRVYEEIYVKEQVSLEGDECSFPSAPTAVPAGAGRCAPMDPLCRSRG